MQQCFPVQTSPYMEVWFPSLIFFALELLVCQAQMAASKEAFFLRNQALISSLVIPWKVNLFLPLFYACPCDEGAALHTLKHRHTMTCTCKVKCKFSLSWLLSWLISLMWIKHLHGRKGWQAGEGSRAPTWEVLAGVAVWLLLSPLSVVSIVNYCICFSYFYRVKTKDWIAQKAIDGFRAHAD